MSDEARWMEHAEGFAREAGALLLEGWRTGPRVEHKGRIDLVTEWDLRSEALLRERMLDAFPDHGWVGEEGEAAHEERALTWFVDPLDGTTNFAHGHFFFAVSLGLARRTPDGLVPILGVVHAPALGMTWRGGPGGAWRGDEPARVSAAQALQESVVATGFPYDRATSPENNLREVAAIVPQLRGIRRCGSAALDLCLVADGTYDGYWEQKVGPWDVCAGLAIATGAGAIATDYEGRPAGATSTRLVVAGGGLHPTLLEAIVSSRSLEGKIDAWS